MKKPYLSLIIATYNEGPTFEKSVEKIITVLDSLKKPWEIIFVEDKSKDNTKLKVEKLTKEIKNSKAIYHKRNQGRGQSVKDGILKAKGEICGYLDVDLEVSADYIPLFLKEVENGADFVVGRRFYERNLNAITRVLASKIYAFMIKSLLSLPISDTEAGYKFFKRSKILPILKKTRTRGWFFDTETCARAYWEGLKITQIPVLFVRRKDKKSTVKLIPDTISYIQNLIKFRSEIPRHLK